jgi:glycosyltransferase involved in cell wall biosynthesis
VPAFSVVICTFNRSGLLGRAIGSVLDQTLEDFELVVVDDGSTDDTGTVVRTNEDPRLRYLRRANGGPSAARNSGVAISTGRYVTFLDDDDTVFPRWLETFRDLLAGDDAVATCGAYRVDEKGRVLATLLPQPLGAAYESCRGQFLSGTFALPRHGFDAVGGFAEGLQASHYAEFALRLLPYCRMLGWPVRVTDDALLRYEFRAREVRPWRQPAVVLSTSEYLLARHHDQLARSPETLANFHARAGVAAARLGRYPAARRHLALAVRAHPRRAKHWLRLGVALVPPVGDAVWKGSRYRNVDAARDPARSFPSIGVARSPRRG